MNMQRNLPFNRVGILSVVCLVTFLSPLMAEVIDEFDRPTLNPDLWAMKQVGKASYLIKDGLLTMTSPDVNSGIMLYFPQNINDVDITFEMKLDISGVVDGIYCASIAKLMEPQVNTDINSNWLASFWVTANKWLIKQDPVVIGQIPPNPFEGPVDPKKTLIAEITYSKSKGKVTVVLNGKEIGVVDKNQAIKERYFYLSPDHYTSHYTGEVKIDYVKISGPGATELLAVDPLGKLATTWGEIKRRVRS